MRSVVDRTVPLALRRRSCAPASTNRPGRRRSRRVVRPCRESDIGTRLSPRRHGTSGRVSSLPAVPIPLWHSSIRHGTALELALHPRVRVALCREMQPVRGVAAAMPSPDCLVAEPQLHHAEPKPLCFRRDIKPPVVLHSARFRSRATQEPDDENDQENHNENSNADIHASAVPDRSPIKHGDGVRRSNPVPLHDINWRGFVAGTHRGWRRARNVIR